MNAPVPSVPPQDIGVIKDLAEYPAENLREPYSRSIIRLKTVTIDMTGEYTCAISTFQDEASNSTKMIVYGKFIKDVTGTLASMEYLFSLVRNPTYF